MRDISNPLTMHKRTMSLFPMLADSDNDARNRLGVLYRLESDRSTGQITLLLQSAVQPDFEALESGYLVGTADNPCCKPFDDFLERIELGASMVFRLRANATRKIMTKSDTNGQKHNGKRVPLASEEALYAWLKRKSSAAGFEVLSVRLIAEGVSGSSGSVRPVNSARFDSCLFEGLLKVIDVTQLRNAIRAGIGPAKAYGFGLLSVAPVRS